MILLKNKYDNPPTFIYLQGILENLMNLDIQSDISTAHHPFVQLIAHSVLLGMDLMSLRPGWQT